MSSEFSFISRMFLGMFWILRSGRGIMSDIRKQKGENAALQLRQDSFQRAPTIQ